MSSAHGRLALLLFLGTLVAGCASTTHDGGLPPPPPADAVKSRSVEEEEADPVSRANRLYSQNDLDGALRVLRGALEQDPSNARARYFYANFLLEKGELRGAARELEQTLALDAREVPATLAWTRLGEIRERLGEHKAALEAYLKSIDAEREAEARNSRDPSKAASVTSPEYTALPHGSPEPFRNVARVCLFLGDTDAAIRAIEEARSRAPRDPLTESLAVRAYQRADDDPRAVQAARTFLEIAGEDPVFSDRTRELREFVRTHSPRLTTDEKAALVDYVRTALRPRMPGETPEDNFFNAQQHARLLARDDRAIWVTVIPQDPQAARVRGRGKGRSLAAAISGAVAQLKDSPRYEPVASRRSAIRIDLERGQLEPIVLSPPENAPLDDPAFRTLVARPPVEPGLHGIALRADDREIYCLPGDAVTEDLGDVKAMLEFAATQAGLSPGAWEGAAGRVFRFQTESFCSPAPGAAPVDLVRGEPVPFPEATPESCSEAAALGALWLANDVVLEESPLAQPREERLPDGEIAHVSTLTLARFHYEYRARDDKFPDEGYNDVRHAGAALGLATAFARTGRPELRDASELAARWLEQRAREVDGRTLIVADDGKARLGTQALALAVEDELAASTLPGQKDEHRAYREGLARTIVGSMRADGTFPAYLATQAGSQNDGESQFYPGEAILALVRHFKATGERRWLDAATKAADARIGEWRSRAQEGVPPLDAWLARAICEMDALEELAGDPLGLSARRAFALEIATAILLHQKGPDAGDAAGGLAPPGELFPKGMPTASLGEGLAAVALMAHARGMPEAGKLRDASRAAASFALRHQYTSRNSFYLAAPDRARGAFRSALASSLVRIDGVQHNVEFLLEVEKLLRE